MLKHPGILKIPPERRDRLFFTSDQHFGHANIIGLCGRPYGDAAEMREALIRGWNGIVPEDGIVIVLGDIFWKRSQMEEHAAVMRRLNGEKHLVLGSHDNLREDDYEALGFASLSRILEVSVKPARMICSHCPFLEWDGYWRGSWHLHGHTHGNLRHPSARALDVGVDPNGYAPVPFERIRRRLEPLAEREMAELAARKRHDPLGALP